MVVVTIVALALPLGLRLSDRIDAEVRSQARGQTDLLAVTSGKLISTTDTGELAQMVRTVAKAVRGRVVITGKTGTLLADSGGQRLGVDFANRPEFRAAQSRLNYQQIRHSADLGIDLLVTASPVIFEGRNVGSVRITQNLGDIQSAKRRAQLGLIATGVAVLLIGLFVGWILAGVVARPLRRLDATARKIADGEIETRARIEGAVEQRSLATSFNRMTERLLVLLRNQKQFVSDASHQLRTPLTGLKLRIEAANGAVPTEDVVLKRNLNAADAQVDHLSKLVDDLLLLSQTDEQSQEPVACDLVQFAEQSMERYAQTAQAQQMTLRLAAADGSALAWCSSGSLQNALDLLVENAINYGPQGQTVEISVGPGVASVSDEGPGFDPAELDEVFARFRRGSASQGTKGTGLGLAIVKGLAVSWGGAVFAENRSEGGARVTLQIPLPPGADQLQTTREKNPHG